MVTHHELGLTDDLGDETEKICQGPILKDSKPLETGESFFWKQTGFGWSERNLCAHVEDRIGREKLVLFISLIVILQSLKIKGHLGGSELQIAELSGAAEQWLQTWAFPKLT